MKLERIRRKFSYRLILSLLLVSLCLNLIFAYQHIGFVRTKAWEALVALGLRDKKAYPQKFDNPVVYYAFLDSLEPVAASSNASQEATSALPDSLIIAPGVYLFHGNTFDMRREGLYRLISPKVENQQRIVYAGNVDALLSGMAWIHSHGNSDDFKNSAEMNRVALNAKVLATCSFVTEWAKELLESQGIKTRKVMTLTLDAWNTWDNGHTLIEVYRSDYGRWVLYDLDNNAYFMRDGAPLSLLELTRVSSSDDYEIKYLADDAVVDPGGFTVKDTGFNYVFLAESKYSNEKALRRWYRRVIQVPLIRDKENDHYNFPNLNARSKVENYSKAFQYLEEEQFIQKFYGENSKSQTNALLKPQQANP
jgi:hypothetical protein